MQRTLILIGIILIVVGAAWPLIGRLGLGRLPGDFVIERQRVRFYFPLATSLLLSAILSLVLWFLRR
jgi:hypothetical protein